MAMNERERPTDLSRLQQRIDQARERGEAADRPDPAKRATSQGYGMAIRLAMEMVAALAVSVGLGLWLDDLLGVAPLFLIILLVMGMAAGVLNVYRTVSGFTHGQLLDKRTQDKTDDDA
jgi:ATP synthase protein I